MQAAIEGEDFQLLLRLHPFGNHVKPQAFRHRDDGLYDRVGTFDDAQATDERYIDLELVQRQAHQVLQRGVTGAEVIHGKLDAGFLHGAHGGNGVFDIVQQQAFGELQLEMHRFDGMALEYLLNLSREIVLMKLFGADIDRQHQVAGVWILLPCLELGASCLHHPLSDGLYQPGFLGQRNEKVRGNHAALRVIPAYQCLRSQRATRTIHLDLVVQLELMLLKCLAQIALQRYAFVDGFLHERIEEAQCVASGFLGLVHRDVGLLHQFIERRLVSDEERGANTGCGAPPPACNFGIE